MVVSELVDHQGIAFITGNGVYVPCLTGIEIQVYVVVYRIHQSLWKKEMPDFK